MRQQLEEMILKTGCPAFVTDCRPAVLRANEAALQLLPGLARSDSLVVLFPGTDRGECAAALCAGKAVFLADPVTPGITAELIPFAGEDGVFAMGRLSVKEEQFTAARRELPEAIAAFSHSYRQPLADMFGMVSVISGHLHARMDDSCDSYLSGLNQNCCRMLRSFSNLTELYKYHTGVYASAEDPVDLWQLCRSLCESAALLTRQSGIPLEWDLPEVPAPVLCHQERFAAAFSNLLANSCCFTREGNAITVTGKITGGRAVLTVSDRGAGIPQSIQSRVFEPFVSFDPEGAPFAGLGIGLALVRSFTEAAGGTLALQSRELEGTSAAISLPLYTGEKLPVSCFDAASLLTDRFSPLRLALADVYPGTAE